MNEFISNNNEIIKNSSLSPALKQNIYNILDIISEIPIIKRLNYIMRNELAKMLKVKSYKYNEYLIKENEPINDIFIVLRGKFITSLNHKYEYNVEHDINTFINYQDITNEPFNIDRNYEITGIINNKNEINIFIYDVRSLLGDIELLSKINKSLFNIKCLEDGSIVGIINRKNFMNIIDKVKLEFKENTENKLDMIQKRVKDILNQKDNLNFDKLKLNKERIAYQLSINHNYKLILDKLSKIKNNINSNTHNKIRNIKLDISNHLELKNNFQNLYSFKKQRINKSKSEINNYEQNITNIFKFPTVLKNDTKIILDNFFEDIYKTKIKKFRFDKIKYDYEPVYLYKFKKISNLTPQKKFEFLYHMKNHLNERLKTPENIITDKQRSKFSNLVLMYNHYITNQSKDKSNTKLSGYLYEKEPIKNRSFGVLNPEIKKNLMSKEEINKKELELKTQRKMPIKLDIIKFKLSSLDKYNLSKKKKIKKKEKLNLKSNSGLYFNSSKLSEEIKKNSFNFDQKKFYNNNHDDNIIEKPHSQENKTKKENFNQNNPKKEEIIKINSSNNINKINKNKKRFSISTSNLYNTTMYKTSKLKSKNIFDMLLKNKYQIAKNHILHSYNIKLQDNDNNNNNLFVNINNNIDIKNEDFVKNFFSRKKFIRSNTFRIIK